MHAEFGISTLQVPHIHDSTPIFNGKVVGQHLGHSSQSLGGEARLKALIHSACRVFQPRRRRLQFFEPRERGVEVCLVEYLGAVDQFAFNRENRDPAPLGIKPLLRGPMCRVSDDCSEVAQPMHGLDIGLVVLVVVRPGVDVCDQVAGPHRGLPAVVDVDPVRRGRGSSCRLIAA